MTIKASIQRYDTGLMIWRSDTRYIWALAHGDDNKAGRAYGFAEADYATLPDNRLVRADGITPRFGFGKVWGNHAAIRDALGWPVEDERQIEMRVSVSEGTTYLIQPDKSIIQINASETWAHYEPTPAPPPGPAPDPDDTPVTDYITRAEHEAALAALRAEMDAKIEAAIKRLPTMDDVADNIGQRLRKPVLKIVDKTG